MSDRHSQLDHKVFVEYPDLMDDDRTCAAFVRMLVEANDAWPRHPYWAGHDDVAVAKLSKAGLVIVEGKRYTIKGLDKRRQVRHDAASKAANAKHADRTADRTADGTADGTEDEENESRGRGISRGIRHRSAIRTAMRTADRTAMRTADRTAMRTADRIDAASAFYDLNAGQASPKALKWVDEMAAEYGDEDVIEAMAAHSSEGRVDLKATQSALALAANQRRKDAEARRKAADAEYERRLQDKADHATPEEKARAAKIKSGIGEFLKGAAS